MSDYVDQSVFSEEEVKALKELRGELNEEENKVTDDMTGVRFLRARKCNIKAAAVMYRDYLKWRKDENIDELYKMEKHPTGDLISYIVCDSTFHHDKCDKYGRPLYIQRCGSIHVNEFCKYFPTKTLARGHTWFNERCAKRMEESSKKVGKLVTQLVLIMDMKGVTLHHRRTAHSFKVTSHIDQNYYPERLGKMYMINCPWFFPALYKLTKLFLDKKTRDKIVVMGEDYKKQLVEDIGAENLPEEYGGTCKCPNGCLGKLYTQEEIKALNLAVPGEDKVEELEERVVPAGDKYTHDTRVEGPKITVEWFFLTVKNDIGFSAIFIPDDGGAKVTLHAYERVEAKEVPITDTFESTGPGTVRLVWDNTFSRWTSKTIKYVVNVTDDPDAELQSLTLDDSKADRSKTEQTEKKEEAKA